MSGWYKMHRGWMDNPAFLKEPFCQRLAWIWMIENAAWEDCTVNVNGKPVALKRGQLSHSIRFLADKFGWSVNRVSRYTTRLADEYMVELKTDTGQTIITICNYSQYQDVKREADTGSDTPTDTPTDTATDTKKKKLRNKEDKNITPPYPPFGGGTQDLFAPDPHFEVEVITEFDRFWDAFPKQRKGNRQKALKAWERALKENRAHSPQEIQTGVESYARSNEVARGYAKGAAAWLNNDGWASDYTIAPQPDTAPTAARRISAHDALAAGFDQAVAILDRMENSGRQQPRQMESADESYD